MEGTNADLKRQLALLSLEKPQPEAEQLAKDLQAPLTTEDDHSICLQERGDFFVLVGFFPVVPLFWEGVDGCNLATSDVRMVFKSLFFRV